jgi:hypothetical protein
MGGARFDWPAFVCVSIDEQRAEACGLPATWRSRPISSSRSWWTHCDRHRPENAELIPHDAPIRVTRVSVTVAIASMLGDPGEATIDARLRVRYALEGVGAAIVREHVHTRGVPAAELVPSPLRLTLAGPPEPVSRDAELWLPPSVAERERRWRGIQAARLVRRPYDARTRVRGELGEGADPEGPTEAPGAPARARRRKAG